MIRHGGLYIEEYLSLLGKKFRFYPPDLGNISVYVLMIFITYLFLMIFIT